MRTWSFALLAAALFAVGGLSEKFFLGSFEEQGAARVSRIPYELGPWRGEEIALDERTYEILETREVLYREYRVADPAVPYVDLLVVFARANRKATHPPEVCYIGSGAHVDGKSIEPLQVSPANRLLVSHGRTQTVVLYWYLVGPRLTTSYYGQQARILWAQLTGRPAQGAMIRCLTLVGDETVEEATGRLKQFAESNLTIILDDLT